MILEVSTKALQHIEMIFENCESVIIDSQYINFFYHDKDQVEIEFSELIKSANIRSTCNNEFISRFNITDLVSINVLETDGIKYTINIRWYDIYKKHNQSDLVMSYYQSFCDKTLRFNSYSDLYLLDLVIDLYKKGLNVRVVDLYNENLIIPYNNFIAIVDLFNCAFHEIEKKHDKFIKRNYYDSKKVLKLKKYINQSASSFKGISYEL